MTNEERQHQLELAENELTIGNYSEAERILVEIRNSTNPAIDLEMEDHASALIKLGTVALKRADYALALEQYTLALDISLRAANNAGVAGAYGNMANVYERQSKHTTALEYYNKALLLDEELGRKARVAVHLGNIAIVYTNTSDYRNALEYYNKALSIDEEIGNKLGVCRHLGNIANVYSNLADYGQALECYFKVLDFAEKSSNKSWTGDILGNIGMAYVKLADYSKALEYIGKSLVLAEDLGNKAAVARNLSNMGILHVNLSNYPEALEHLYKALELSDALGDKAGMAVNLGNIGIVYRKLADYSEALVNYERALSIVQGIGDKHAEATWFTNIGNFFSELLENTKALEYHMTSLRLAEEVGDKSLVAGILCNIGSAYWNLSDFTLALEYFMKALSQAEQLGSQALVATILGNIARVHEKNQAFDQAAEYYSKALHMHDDLGTKSDAAALRTSIGGLYMNQNWNGWDVAKAEELLQQSLKSSEVLGTKNYEAYKSLSELYAMQERWKESHLHFKKYHDLEKEVHSAEAKKSALLMEQKKEVAEREKQYSVERAEARATQTVLHQVLPASIASRLIKGEKVADYFQNVSILFADIVGFTPIASRMPAKAVLTFLNYVFGEFDRMAAACGCEKIKTIGDGYLAVAGAPDTCEDHAERIARLAIEMSNDIILPDEIRKTLPKGAQFNLRIGIHTGPAFGGIVGENRFVYDIYSDAVNLAARMESHGEAGKIHVSDEFCFHLQNRMDMTGEDFGGIRFDERDEMQIKGKGLMRTYFLERSHL